MAWEEPKTDWQVADVVSKDDFNRIEGNAQHLKDAKADKTEFNLHVNNKSNPHNVTAAQVGRHHLLIRMITVIIRNLK